MSEGGRINGIRKCIVELNDFYLTGRPAGSVGLSFIKCRKGSVSAIHIHMGTAPHKPAEFSVYLACLCVLEDTGQEVCTD